MESEATCENHGGVYALMIQKNRRQTHMGDLPLTVSTSGVPGIQGCPPGNAVSSKRDTEGDVAGECAEVGEMVDEGEERCDVGARNCQANKDGRHCLLSFQAPQDVGVEPRGDSSPGWCWLLAWCYGLLLRLSSALPWMSVLPREGHT
jgi:hypothetical protein